MAATYSFGDLVRHSGASRNEMTNWVQTGLIRADISDTPGTGIHRAFSFLGVFEACVLQKLNQLPGGMPTAAMGAALEVLRVATALGDATPWGQFVNRDTRDAAVRLWLYFPRSWAEIRVVNAREREALLNDARELVLLMRLDTILSDLEHTTQDHATAAECAQAFMKPESMSLQSQIEAAMRRELTTAGLSEAQIQKLFEALHEKLAALKPSLRASATFTRYVEMVDGLVALRGAGPGYAAWKKDVAALLATWKKQAPRDARVMAAVSSRQRLVA